MHRLATAFAPDLTDPGPDGTPRVNAPVESDKIRIAAIHDRFSQMYDVARTGTITLTRTPPAGGESWGGRVGLPRLTRNVAVAPTFFALSAVDQVKHLVRLMAHGHSDISISFESKYVEAIDLIRRHRGLGP
jgi:hypothetical protein